MKAVATSRDGERWTAPQGAEVEMLLWRLWQGLGSPQRLIQYDNGHLCTFRRKQVEGLS